MSNITVDNVFSSEGNIQKQLENETIIDWNSVNASQQAVMQGYQQIMEKLVQFRDGMQRNFMVSIKEMKQLDAKDLLKQVKENKIDKNVLKTLVDYSIQDDTGIKIDLPALKDDGQEKQKKFQQLTESSSKKLSEISKWFDSFISENKLNVPVAPVQQQQQSGELQKQQPKEKLFKFDDEKLNKIVSEITVENLPGTQALIGIKTYSQIVEQSIELAQSEFVRLTMENREKRRDQKADTKAYLKLMMDHLNDIENMLMQSQEDICFKLGITQKKLEQSEITLMERGFAQQLFMMQASVRQRIKEKLPRKESVTATVTKEIIERQIKLLNESQDQFLPLLKEMPQNYETQQLVPVILNLRISDLIFDEYNFEEEDYMHNLSDQNSFKEQEIMALLQQLEEGILKLLQSSGLMPTQPQGMPGMPPMGGQPSIAGMGGGMPPMGGGMPPMGGMPGMF